MNDIIYITCIGIDEKIHKCEPHLNICKCGIVVKSKKLSKNDYERCSCYECTY
jgi:hypothetical protein